MEPDGRAPGSSLRVFVTGPVGVQHAGGFVDASSLPGRQGRALFALLVVRRQQPLARDVVADALWGENLPAAWGTAVSSLVSKIRRLLEEADPSGRATVRTAFGAHQMSLPADTWIDVEVARLRLDRAEASLRDGADEPAWADAHVAWSIATRDFLAGEEAPWVHQQRRELEELAVRGLACLSEVWLRRGEFELAARCSSEVLARQPFREDAYRRLMRAQAAAGNRAEALRTFEICRRLLADELGIDPDPETAALHGELLAPAPGAATGRPARPAVDRTGSARRRRP